MNGLSSRVVSFQQNHLSALGEIASSDCDEIDAFGDPGGVPLNLMVAKVHLLVQDCFSSPFQKIMGLLPENWSK